MSAHPIPFEIHITTHLMGQDEVATFEHFCQNQGVKPLLVQLARGKFHRQPMTSMVLYASSLEQALAAAEPLRQAMMSANFPVLRIKVEIPAFDAEPFYDPSAPNYFEWHGKVVFERSSELLALCQAHDVHLSHNALKDATHTRFVTLRDYGPEAQFNGRLQKLKSAVTNGGWEIIKQESEYCIYDSNQLMDQGWLDLKPLKLHQDEY